jgi:hypothetical protein
MTPIDFDETLALLCTWSGRRVVLARVPCRSRAPLPMAGTWRRAPGVAGESARFVLESPDGGGWAGVVERRRFIAAHLHADGGGLTAEMADHRLYVLLDDAAGAPGSDPIDAHRR